MNNNTLNKDAFERLYTVYNKRENVINDPIKYLYKYDCIKDREIVGLIASSLAYGRVAQIQRSVEKILDRIESPFNFITKTPDEEKAKLFKDFKHRFTTSQELILFFEGIRNTIDKFGSLEKCFISGYHHIDQNIYPAMLAFSSELLNNSPCRNSLMPDPSKKSAFKRLNLFLRWMIRKDNIDPGGWNGIPASKLLYPLDTHIHKLGLALKITEKKQSTIAASMEITEAFKIISPDDPVKYDFPLACLSISSGDHEEIIKKYGLAGLQIHLS